MKYKKFIYLIVIMLSMIATGFDFIGSVEGGATGQIRLFEFTNMTGLGLIVLALIVLKIAFDISFVFEMVLLVIGTAGITIMNLMELQIGAYVHSMMALTVFPILGALFIIEYVKDLLLSDKVFTSSGILVKSLLSAINLFFIIQIGSVYQSVSAYKFGRASENIAVFITLFFMAMIYIVKMGYKREIRDLVEHSYFVEDLKRLMKDTLKVYEMILIMFYFGIFFLYFNDLLVFQFAFAFMIGGIFFAARGYRQWMFPFILIGTLSLTTYIGKFTVNNTALMDLIKISSLDYAKGTAYGIILVLAFIWVSRVVIATSNRNNES